MNSLFYLKLASNNLKKNRREYIPYVVASICAIISFYTMCSIIENEGLNYISGGEQAKMLLDFAKYVIGIFSVIFLFYTNSFLIKRRTKELGLYNVLGMEKKHIYKVIFFEALMIFIISLVLGIFSGIMFSKLLFLILLKCMNVDVKIFVSISIPAFISTFKVFLIAFVVILINNFIKVKISNPIELLKSEQSGEKVPKASKIFAISGVLELIIGYLLANSGDNCVVVFDRFFIAVLFVMAGTYSTFRAGSIAILKLLKKNKKFFYKSNNFISVSGMIYRMKQNSIGLANICILSTAVLLTVSTTVCLYLGMESSLRYRHLQDVNITVDNFNNVNLIEDIIDKEERENNVSISNKFSCTLTGIECKKMGNVFEFSKERNYRNLNMINLMILDDYNKIEGKNFKLDDDEVGVFSEVGNFNEKSIIFKDKTYKVKEEINTLRFQQKSDISITNNQYVLVVKDKAVLKNIYENMVGSPLKGEEYNIFFDLNGDKNDIMKFSNNLEDSINSNEGSRYSSIYSDRRDYYALNGSFLFIGVFLGLLFAMSTVLIIYYKQISEGYEDRKQFEIMQKVGMSRKEIKKTINKQILMVFFLPLLTAIIHIVFAFRNIKIILVMFYLHNVKLFLQCTLATIIVFGVLYTIVYMSTAKTYYSIVKD